MLCSGRDVARPKTDWPVQGSAAALVSEARTGRRIETHQENLMKNLAAALVATLALGAGTIAVATPASAAGDDGAHHARHAKKDDGPRHVAHPRKNHR